MKIYLQTRKYIHPMTYGERLYLAMIRRGEALGREIERKEVAHVAGCSVQNIGMILANAKGSDQTLSARSHAKVAYFLRVNPDWLLDEVGTMEAPTLVNAPRDLTPAAIEIAMLFDMLPLSDKIRRAQAFNVATDAIILVLQSSGANGQASQGPKKPPV